MIFNATLLYSTMYLSIIINIIIFSILSTLRVLQRGFYE
jgi:hypothetical protein